MIVESVLIENYDCFAVTSELLEREDLKEFLESANSAGRYDESVCLIFHDLFALSHGLSGYQLGDILKQYSINIKE